MTTVLAIDAGTTSVRTIAFDERARPLAASGREFTQYFPAPGWVEHDASETWEAVQATPDDVTAQLDEPPAASAVEPSASRTTVDAAYADWKRAVQRSRDWAR